MTTLVYEKCCILYFKVFFLKKVVTTYNEICKDHLSINEVNGIIDEICEITNKNIESKAKKVNFLNSELDTALQEIDKLKRKEATFKDAHRESEEKIKYLEEDLKRFTGEYRNTRVFNSFIHQELKNSNYENAKLNEQLKKLLDENESNIEEIKSLKFKIANMNEIEKSRTADDETFLNNTDNEPSLKEQTATFDNNGLNLKDANVEVKNNRRVNHWDSNEITYLVYFVQQLGKNWKTISTKYNEYFNNRNVSTLYKKYYALEKDKAKLNYYIKKAKLLNFD